jgi:hypothetical protein
MNFENFTKRLKRRIPWFLFIVIASIISYFVGKTIIENFRCPEFQKAFLVFINVLIAVIGLIWAMLRKSVATIWKILSVLLIFCAGVGIPFLFGEVIAQTEYVKTQFCPEVDLDYCDLVYELLEEGHLDAAEDTAYKCIENSVSIDQELECEEALGDVLVAQLDQILEVVEDNQYDPIACDIANNKLIKLNELINPGRGAEDLQSTYQQLSRRKELACQEPTPIPPTAAPTPTPTLVANFEIDLIRIIKGETDFMIDFRIYRDNQQVRDLTSQDFLINAEEKEIDISGFEEKASDDPICLVAVVDNSGSVSDGLADIRSAIETLNGQRKSEDLLGLIVFSSPAEIRIQELSVDPLDSSRIDARGDLTAIWHAVDQGLSLLDGCEFETKYLILLTDGDNNVPYNMKDSNANARDLREKAMNMAVNICPIGVESDALNSDPLALLATNCSYTTAENFDSVAGLFMDIFGYVRDFYRIMIPRAGNENTELFLEYIVDDSLSIIEGISTNGQ